MTPAYHQQPMVQQSAEFFGQPKTDSGLNPEEAAQKRWLRRKKKVSTLGYPYNLSFPSFATALPFFS